MLKFDRVDFLMTSAVACALLGLFRSIPDPETIEIPEIEIYDAGARSFRLGYNISKNPFDGVNEERSRIWRMGFRSESEIHGGRR